MAYRPYHRASGKAKSNASYDPELEVEVRDWMSNVLGQPIPAKDDIADVLKDGQLLCNLANRLQPGAISKVNTKTMPFMKMENIGSFVAFMKTYGVPDQYSFVTVDLYEKQNIKQVVIALSWLKRKAEEKNFKA